MKRAIITGATGTLGIALINELVKKNIEILVLCRKGSVRNFNIPQNKLITIRYCALDELTTLQNDTGKNYDVFFHLAWQGTTGTSRNDMYLQNNNVRYSLDAVSVAARFGCCMFIGVGSQAEYGRTNNILTPDTPVNPESGYGISKLCAGQMTRLYANIIGIKHIWVRVCSVYGPYDNDLSMIAQVINSLRNCKVPKCTAGEQNWDYLFSGDAAVALRLLGDFGVSGKTYVLGSGISHKLKDYIMEIVDVVKPDMEVEFGAVPYSKNQVMNLCADISSLVEDIGWHPVTPFREGIKITLNELITQEKRYANKRADN